MAVNVNKQLTPARLRPKLERLLALSGEKILLLHRSWDPSHGAPVFTRQGRYTARGWTEWTQGFQFGSAVLQFEATGEATFLDLGRILTVQHMASHVSHHGVHDHGFNNLSTYGNLLRLLHEGKMTAPRPEWDFYELALKVSGAVQAARWTRVHDGAGFIYSFNGPHSLFIDTMRSLRSLAVAHRLGHALMSEHDQRVSLLGRLVEHALTTARYAIYYGEGRDAYDVRGRTAHESIFNLNDGHYRCPNSQQGYSPFSTWTRGLAWAILGFSEILEFMATVTSKEFVAARSAGTSGARRSRRASAADLRRSARTSEPLSLWEVRKILLKAALATADYYLASSPVCGVPYWDTGAPGLPHLGDYQERPADPYNSWEPVDSSAGVIAAQGLWRLGNYLLSQNEANNAVRYQQGSLTIADTLFAEPYLSIRSEHQGLLLHSVYHRPNGWDYVAPKQRVPNGESSLWGDYHARELALLLLREAKGDRYLAFFNGCAPVLSL
jgi:unsaturated chondroitin disaccharide hydrolase